MGVPQRGQYPWPPSITVPHRGQITNGGGPPCTRDDTGARAKALLLYSPWCATQEFVEPIKYRAWGAP